MRGAEEHQIVRRADEELPVTCRALECALRVRIKNYKLCCKLRNQTAAVSFIVRAQLGKRCVRHLFAAEGPHGSAVLNHGDVIHKTLLSLSQCGSKYLVLSDELVRRGAADGTDEVIA